VLDDRAKGAVEGLATAILNRKSSNQSDQQRTHTQIETQSLVLRDAHGRGRAVLAMLDNGPVSWRNYLDGRFSLGRHAAIAILFLIHQEPVESVGSEQSVDGTIVEDSFIIEERGTVKSAAAP
jgi:hypothetical protein